MEKGKRLAQGDVIGVIAPSSPADEKDVEKAKSELEALGFRVKLGQNCFESYGGYLAGTPISRAHEIHSMFTNKGIDAIMCLRGGYGTPHLLDLLDFDLLKKNPKVFIGYSDITALHISLQQKANLATIHGPMATRGIGSLHPLPKKYLLQAIMEAKPLRKIINPEEEEICCLVKGRAKGKIIGGNLSLIIATMGTPYEIDTRGKLLFLEDVGEEPYRIDRMLTQLRLAGKFEEAAGIILGSWQDCEPIKYPDCFSIPDLFERIIAPFSKPAIYNVQSGHDQWNIPLPLGVEASLDATNKTLIIEESVVY